MLGNAWQWVADCWNESYVGAPGDGRPWATGRAPAREQYPPAVTVPVYSSVIDRFVMLLESIP